MTAAAWMFPGQGSQRPQMAADFAACKALFEVARPILGDRVERMCIWDPSPVWHADLLQPALFITSVGAARALEAKGLSPAATVGHSLGEYAALVAAGALGVEDGIRLVHLRGKAMAAAARRNPGAMAAVIGLDPATLRQICEEVGGVWVANLNSPSQTVLSGRDSSLAAAAERARMAGAKRVIRLDVPMAGHCPLMEPAADEFAGHVAGVTFNKPAHPFYSVADARVHCEASEIPELLVKAITSPVLFTQTIEAMHADGITALTEAGPGSVLRGLVKKICPGIELWGASTDAEVQALPDAPDEQSPGNYVGNQPLGAYS